MPPIAVPPIGAPIGAPIGVAPIRTVPLEVVPVEILRGALGVSPPAGLGSLVDAPFLLLVVRQSAQVSEETVEAVVVGASVVLCLFLRLLERIEGHLSVDQVHLYPVLSLASRVHLHVLFPWEPLCGPLVWVPLALFPCQNLTSEAEIGRFVVVLLVAL